MFAYFGYCSVAINDLRRVSYLGYCSVAAIGSPMWAAAARTLALLAATASKCEIIGRNFTWKLSWLKSTWWGILSQPACHREKAPRSRERFCRGFSQQTSWKVSSIRSQERSQVQRMWIRALKVRVWKISTISCQRIWTELWKCGLSLEQRPPGCLLQQKPVRWSGDWRSSLLVPEWSNHLMNYLSDNSTDIKSFWEG